MRIARYQQRPPEVDALLVDASTTDLAVAWLRAFGRDAYRSGQLLHVLPAPGATGFDVPDGHHLVRDVASGGWAPVPPGRLAAEYQPHPPIPPERWRPVAWPRWSGQPGGGL